ncbi:MAG: class B sortase [Bacilli bacterium]|nr:class B sortase [Bacilli bacterium]
MKNKIIEVITLIIVGICIFNIGNSLYHIYLWKKDSNEIKEEIDNIENIVEVKEKKDSTNTEVIEQEEIVEEINPYWAYMSMNMIEVDFYDLKEVNSDTAGWILVNGTNINYPFVQAKDNKFYLNHTFNKKYNSAGWVFLDYRNKNDLSDKNNIIYAHGRIDKTMFGSLRNALTNGWLDNKDNYVIKISTPYDNSMWQVFSVYHIKTTSDYLKIDFKSDESFLEFANMLKERSAKDFNTTVSKNDQILTLSTCYSNEERVVIHAKLIKKERRTN